MKAHHSRRLRVGAGLASLAVVGVFLPSGAVAAGGDPTVVNTETVSVYTDANGAVQSRRVYEQLTVTGSGEVSFDNPIEESGLRNLDGFGGFDVSEGMQRVEAEVDGVSRFRTVSDYAGDLPLEVDIEYVLDGEEVAPGDVVGEEGDLEVSYTVRNVTAAPREISFPDGKGGTVTETVDVPIPMVGSLTTTLPSSFTQVRSDQANMAGDGRGGTKLSFTMTLVPPIGSDTASFGYTARIKDGIVPRAVLSALPVNPLESPTFATAAASYQGGAETGATLTAGATEIDGHLLEIRDGASKLLNGLILLRNGSQQLEEGLAGKAAPGAQRLADGTSELRDGLTEIDDGAGQLADGAGRLDDGANQIDDGAGRLDAGAGQLADGADRLAAGTGDALTGSEQLYAGLTQISDGLDVLAGQEGLPKALDGVKQLQGGVDRILAGFGDLSTAGTLINGLHRLELGAGQVEGGLLQLLGDGSPANPGLVAAKGGVDQVQAGLADAVAPGGSLDQLIAGLTALKGLDCGPVCQGVIDTRILPGVEKSKSDLTQASGGLLLVSGGLAKAVAALETLLIPGAGDLAAGAAAAKGGAIELRDGVAQVDGGLGQLETGLTAAVAGVLKLAAGADAAESGSGSLADGLALISGGAGELSDGADLLSAGTGELSAGAGQLKAGTGELSFGALRLATGTGDAREGAGLIADGAGELSTGLKDAADGSTRLKDGLTEAAQAAPALPDGAARLSDEGMSKLVAAGEATAQEYGKLYAIVAAGSERAQTEDMALGAPEEAVGLTAYSFEIQGQDGEGGRNAVRGLGALVAGGLGLGAFALRRRLV